MGHSARLLSNQQVPCFPDKKHIYNRLLPYMEINLRDQGKTRQAMDTWLEIKVQIDSVQTFNISFRTSIN